MTVREWWNSYPRQESRKESALWLLVGTLVCIGIIGTLILVP